MPDPQAEAERLLYGNITCRYGQERQARKDAVAKRLAELYQRIELLERELQLMRDEREEYHSDA